MPNEAINEAVNNEVVTDVAEKVTEGIVEANSSNTSLLDSPIVQAGGWMAVGGAAVLLIPKIYKGVKKGVNWIKEKISKNEDDEFDDEDVEIFYDAEEDVDFHEVKNEDDEVQKVKKAK